MQNALILAILASTAVASNEARVPVGSASLYARDIGKGPPIIVLHGGPDFDHSYLVPDLDRLADAYRLIYYDQRGRGRSRDGFRAVLPAEGARARHSEVDQGGTR
jgi:pimeloyl-ACP methyl ester carboxylesterase